MPDKLHRETIRLFRPPGGVHPAYRKERTAARPVEPLPLPAVLRVPMAQHIGAPAQPVVKKGDPVLRGQLIGEPGGFVSAAVHAPTSGTVRAVSRAPTPAGPAADTVEIEPDGEDRPAPGLRGRRDWETLPPPDLVSIVAAAGIVGMGGAGFPTHVKLSPPADKPIDTLIINGAECEPYLTADHRLMVEHAAEIRTGCRILRRILGAAQVRIAVEDNKPDAVAAMQAAAAETDGDVAVVPIETAYPQGAEKQQIFALTGREVPSGGLPMDVGAIVENVGTTFAVWDAVVNGQPLIERVTTVTGSHLARPANLRVRIGTPYEDLLGFCGAPPAETAKIIAGGPMMGLAQPSLQGAVTKTTSGLLLLTHVETFEFESMPCIGCGRCVQACPMRLLPCELSLMLEAEDYEAAESYGVLDCIECGCCAYVCPAHRPLVQHMKQGKARVMVKRRKK